MLVCMALLSSVDSCFRETLTTAMRARRRRDRADRVLLIRVEYYEQLGRTAYGQRTREEMAAQFARFVEVFGELRAHTTLACPHDVATLYERWRATGSDWLEGPLRACGVILLEPGTTS